MATLAEVKTSHLTHRQRQAMQTKGLIVEAARNLFGTRGYAETSMEAVAEEAGVSPRTVYTSFGNKKGLLAAICEAWLAEAGLSDAMAEGLASNDLPKRLRLVARVSRRQWEVERGTRALMQGAAASDADVARMIAGWQEDRASQWPTVFAGLESQLRPDVDARKAVALLRALTGAETYFELVRGLGWTPDEYEEWLVSLFITQLLPA